MNNITGFLQKFFNLEKNQNSKIAVILEIIKKETNLELKKEDLEFIGDNLKIKCNPVFRNEIFMRKEKIEEDKVICWE